MALEIMCILIFRYYNFVLKCVLAGPPINLFPIKFGYVVRKMRPKQGCIVFTGFFSVLHIFFFIITGLVSLVGAESFCKIFDIFNYRCILYAKASTKFQDIVYKNSTVDVDNTTEVEEEKPEGNFQNIQLNLGIFEEDYEIEMRRHPLLKFDINKAKKVPGVKDIYVLNEELWVDNETLTGRAHVGMTSTVFESIYLCDFVVFVPFLSVIICATFGLIVLMFSRTGRGALHSIPPAFLYVYPLIVAAGTMTVCSVVASNLLHTGLEVFCEHFSHLTGLKECSPLMDYFTKEQKLGYRHIYHHMVYSRWAYSAASLLWLAQLIVGLLRLLTTADYTLNAVLIKSKKTWDDEEAEDIFHMQWDDATAPQLATLVERVRRESRAP